MSFADSIRTLLVERLGLLSGLSAADHGAARSEARTRAAWPGGTSRLTQ